MRTVGQILKKTRGEKNIALPQVAAQTKIRQDVLSALEEDDFQKISSVASIKGLLKTYAEFLDLPSEQVLAIFRRDFGKKEKKKVIPQGILKPIDKRGFNLTAKNTLFLVVAIFLVGLGGWLLYQYLSLVRPPTLKIFGPLSGVQVTEEKVLVTGRTDPDALVTVNGETVSLSARGEFQYQLRLFPGENNLVIEATSKLGKKNKVERVVFFKPPT
ncbi:hypothetical protein FJZ41_00125 [Candidatus Shapirobacteria bacterium]|nr:hypothetical protein [Candidatus Shapirobacteria bacterium]